MASVCAVALDPRLKAEGDDESGWLGEAAADNVCTRQPAPQALPSDAFGDRPKGIGIQAGAADQGAVDIGLGQQLAGVVGLHRAAVEDAHLLGALADPADPQAADLPIARASCGESVCQYV